MVLHTCSLKISSTVDENKVLKVGYLIIKQPQPDEEISAEFIASCFSSSVCHSQPVSFLFLLTNIYFHLSSLPSTSSLAPISSPSPRSNFSSLFPLASIRSSLFSPNFVSTFPQHVQLFCHTHTHSENQQNFTLTTI